MNLVWLVVGIGILGILAKRMISRPERNRPADLGSVSQHWVAEHRSSQISGPQQ